MAAHWSTPNMWSIFISSHFGVKPIIRARRYNHLLRAAIRPRERLWYLLSGLPRYFLSFIPTEELRFIYRLPSSKIQQAMKLGTEKPRLGSVAHDKLYPKPGYRRGKRISRRRFGHFSKAPIWSAIPSSKCRIGSIAVDISRARNSKRQPASGGNMIIEMRSLSLRIIDEQYYQQWATYF